MIHEHHTGPYPVSVDRYGPGSAPGTLSSGWRGGASCEAADCLEFFVCRETFTTDRDPVLLVAVRGTALAIHTRNIGPLLVMIFQVAHYHIACLGQERLGVRPSNSQERCSEIVDFISFFDMTFDRSSNVRLADWLMWKSCFWRWWHASEAE